MSINRPNEQAAQKHTADAACLRGIRALENEDETAALHAFKEALTLDPQHPDANANLGYLHYNRGDVIDAEIHLRQAIELSPQCAEAHLNLGALLTTSKRYGEAEAVCQQAIACRPLSPQAWSNLGVLYARQKREAEAEQCYRTAMSIDADHLASRFNLSYLLLRHGHYEEGWSCLEARRWYAPLEDKLLCPRWHGEPLQGKSLLIVYEAGHGDMIQFVRYAQALRQQAPTSIDLLCHPALKSLFSVQCAIDRVHAFNEDIPVREWDYWSPPLSLPYYCRTRLDNIPDTIPYLRASAEKVAAWAPRIPGEGFRVGLVWKGSTGFENDADRSLPALDLLVPLGGIDAVRFIGLQKGAGENEVPSSASRALDLINLGPLLQDFSDTAAIVSQLDLVISVDTAVAHLAGALGVRSWILLPDHMTDWRWLTDRDDSPWYPGVVRLFRQTTAGRWEDVVIRLHSALSELAADLAARN
ncbi:tetratricopeptide repeat protein [Propionivibrio dicarboxylicus]|uniref:Tfp pilus assembly protein PilF n=1 Tax=Propionivibrio dicarboxylicus TaxID=83767 RepID=A0A1G8EBS9_9RHOO|nr:tetratricopeptide repeat protein [Propionivibrio dicarboxylicus]SDH67348.1 Tfp pilus assembly protein PilF [Propionivibrio dicarboxylicus]